jgi:rhamnulokinase
MAFDLGASSGRAVLGTLKNRRLQLRDVSRFSNGMVNVFGHLHWDIYKIFENVKKGMGVCASEFKVLPESVAVDTWGVDFGLLDTDGRILGLPFCYRDQRTDNIMDMLFHRIPKERLYEVTGTQFLQFNSLFQLYAMKKEKSSLLESAAHLLFMPDLLNYMFTGEMKTEFSIATTSQLYNPFKDSWEEELFNIIEVSVSIMQEIVQPGTILAELDKTIGKETGFNSIPVVCCASHDTGSAVAAVPAEGDGWVYISSGTWSLMGVEVRDPVATTQAMNLNFTNEGGVGSTIRFLKNISGLWLIEECRRVWARKKDYTYEELIHEAESATPFQYFIDPDYSGFLNPSDMIEAIRKYCVSYGHRSPETPAEFVRCILESLALKYRVTLDQLRRVHKGAINVVHIIGGGVRNRLLCQFTANSTGLPVVAGPVEATATGNIMVQAMAMGHVKSLSEIRDVVRNSFDLDKYEPRDMRRWEAAYQRFLEVTKKAGI